MKRSRLFGNKKAGARPGANPAYGYGIHNSYDRCVQGSGQGLDRSLLPDPYSFYSQELHHLSGSGKWLQACCPFHDDRHPSFSINIENGGFFCHACGARGGDVLSFYMKRYEVSFITAAKALGAWGDAQ